MSKATQTKLMRMVRIKGEKKPKVVDHKVAQPRELVTCPGCGEQKYLSVEQIWNCKHPRLKWNPKRV